MVKCSSQVVLAMRMSSGQLNTPSRHPNADLTFRVKAEGSTAEPKTCPSELVQQSICISERGFMAVLLCNLDLVKVGSKDHPNEISFAFQPAKNSLHIAKSSAVGYQEFVKYPPVEAKPEDSIVLPHTHALCYPR